jgi:hypothetical protein
MAEEGMTHFHAGGRVKGNGPIVKTTGAGTGEVSACS